MAMRNFRYFVNEFCMSPNLFERFRMENMHIRQAQAAHHRAVVACVRAAYSKYLVRMDREPAPLHADYKALIAQGVVYVLVTEEEVRGVLVMMPQQRRMFVENVAVDPRFQDSVGECKQYWNGTMQGKSRQREYR